jgi:KUP system potassium uptake protein
MALLALAAHSVADRPKLRHLYSSRCLRAALFWRQGDYARDLSALGAWLAVPDLTPYVVQTLAVLVVLFLVQNAGPPGSSRIRPCDGGLVLVLAVVGVVHVIRAPVILSALNPFSAFEFALRHQGLAFVALGSVVLALTVPRRTRTWGTSASVTVVRL